VPEIEIPVTTYRVSSTKPNQRWGSPAAMPLASNTHRVLIKVPIDRVPTDATIVSAVLQFNADRVVASGKNIRVTAPSEPWTASVTWNTQPAVGSVLDTDTTATTAAENPLPGLDVTSWAVTRSRNGLRLESTTAAPASFWVRGSSGADAQPLLLVEYTVVADTPGNMRPDGGSVSVSQPILTYAGDEDMTAQRIEFSPSGDVGDIVFDSGWLPASEGRFDPAGVVGSPVLSDGATGIWWRATTDGPDSQSAPGEWAYYEYDSLPDVAIVNPPATTDDGSPTLTWTVEDDRQVAWRAKLESGSKAIDDHVWADEADTRDWSPGASVEVPDGSGRFTLKVRDDVTPRVAAEDAPTEVTVVHDFTTTLTGAATAVNTLEVTVEDPIPVISGTRSLGTPDEVRLLRDGVGVPLWDADGNVYQNWAPAAEFFTGTDFEIRDYTARGRTEPVWSVRTRVGSTVSAEGPTATTPLFTPSVWLVDPRTGEQVEIQGWGDVPVVSQETVEQSILHVPVNGGLTVEPKRRRLVRTTRFGTIEGVVLNEDEALLDSWILAGSGLKYRLIFGKVNWPVIIGDAMPVDTFYADRCGDDRTMVTLNWWQRLTDV
jgi:hypothetical protein